MMPDRGGGTSHPAMGLEPANPHPSLPLLARLLARVAAAEVAALGPDPIGSAAIPGNEVPTHPSATSK
jgi:hypothetical protein